jgi:hypothetical protein
VIVNSDGEWCIVKSIGDNSEKNYFLTLIPSPTLSPIPTPTPTPSPTPSPALITKKRNYDD